MIEVRRLFVLSFLVQLAVPALTQTVTLTPASLTFSAEVLNTSGASKSVTLKNVGKNTLEITSMSASGGFITTACPSTIAPGGSCQFSVTFMPNALGVIDGAITIIDNANPHTQVVSLTGNGIAPITFSPAMLTFIPTAIGTTSAPKTVKLTNNLTTSVTMGNLTTTGDYELSNNGCTGSVAAGGTCNIAVTFSPTLKGAIAGAITVSDSAPYQPQAVALSGSGTGTVTNPISFLPTSLTFAGQAVGTTSTGQIVTLKNKGKVSVSIGTVAASGNYLESDTCSGQAIRPQGACTITVQFQPSADGSIAGAITVSDNAATTPQVIGLKGTGTGAFSFSPGSLAFGLQSLNLPSVPLSASLSNDSGADISISSIVISGNYSQTNNCGSILLANSSCTFSVTYMPGATGATDGAITVTAGGTQGGQVLSLTGSGINPARYAYSIVQNEVEAYAVDPVTGFLRFTALQTLPDACGSNNALTVAPSTTFVYIPSLDACQSGGPIGIFGYSVGSNGQLTPVTGSPFNVGTYPYQITLTPNGKFGYVTDLGNYPPANIIPVSVDAKTGAVTQLSGALSYPGSNIPSGAIDPASKFLFLSDVESGGVYAYTINPTTGALSLVAASPFSTGGGSGTFGIAVHPSGEFLVTLALDGPSVFKINAKTGALILVPGSPFSAPDSLTMALDPSRNFVYAAQTQTVTVFRLNATTGALAQVPGSPFSTGGLYNSSLTTDPSGHFLYLGTSLSDGDGSPVLQLVSVSGQTGSLAPVTTIGGVPFADTTIDGFTAGAKPVTFTPVYAYVANSPVVGDSNQNGIFQYSINPSNGTLTQVGSLHPESFGPQVLAMQPLQQYLYTSIATGVIYGYEFLAGGSLNRIALADEPVTSPTYSIVVDPAGAWLFGTDPAAEGSTEAAIWQINRGGSLGSLAFGTYFFTGPGVAITASPAAFGPLAISSNNTLWGLYDPSNTGASWGTFPVGNSPSAVAVDGAGRFVYVANSADNTISGFGDSSNLTGLNGGVPFATGTTPSAIAGDPWGRYLYVANAGSQNIWEYSIDPLTGNLTPLSASPLSLGVSPNSLTIDFTGQFLYTTNSAAGTVSAMSINADGSLSLQGTTTVDSGATQSPAPTSIATTGVIK